MTDKDFVLSKIDWKFFNFLKDKATAFEDDGHIISIFVIIRTETKVDTYLFRYENGHDKECELGPIEYRSIKKGLETDCQLLYLIKCVATGGMGYCDQASKLGTDYYDRIKSKCTIQSNERLGVFTVKPD